MSDLPIAVSPEDLDPQWVVDAYRHISMTTDGPRIAQYQRDYVDHITHFHDDLAPIAETNEQRAILAEGLEAYRVRYLELMRAWLAAKSSTTSTMIAGPSRFNHRQNQRQLDAEDRRREELVVYTRTAKAALREALLDARTPEAVEEAEFRRLRLAAIDTIGTLRGIELGEVCGDPALFRRSLAGKLRTSHKAGHTEAVRRVLQFVREVEGQYITQGVFAPRNKIWELAA